MRLRSFVAFLSCCLCFVCSHSIAQIGVQVSRFIPQGDIGQYFNKGTSLEIFAVDDDDEDNWKCRVGFCYVALSPRQDTVPTYAIKQDGSVTTILPGYLVNRNFSMKYMSADVNRRLIDIHGFSLYIGLGIVGGISHADYYRGYETMLIETADIDTWIIGVKLNSMLQYRINDHMDVFLDGCRNLISSVDMGTAYSNYKIGLGFNYYLEERE